MTIVRAPNAETIEVDVSSIEPGQWYRVRTDLDDGTVEEALHCVEHIGSNHVRLKSVEGPTAEILFTNFEQRCIRVDDANAVIQKRVTELQEQVKEYLREVNRLSIDLAIDPRVVQLGSGPTEALVRAGEGRDLKDYRDALVRAKKESLPDLFNKIEATHEELALWLAAPTLPLRAQSESLTAIVRKIDRRVFDVSLYAGLTEQVVEIASGSPAALETKVHLMQRRHYMDEECLMSYEAGGMEFAQIGAFDEWLARPVNRDRILPFPRCIVAFRVRRTDKEREITSLWSFIRILDQQEADKQTFLYIRNGDRLYRMDTDVDFGEKLFPDLDRQRLTGPLWAKVDWHGAPIDVITDNEYQGLRAADA